MMAKEYELFPMLMLAVPSFDCINNVPLSSGNSTHSLKSELNPALMSRCTFCTVFFVSALLQPHPSQP